MSRRHCQGRRCSGLTDLSTLGGISDIWEEWRFEPWKVGTAEGLYRRLTMVKSSLIGEVARYYADDYIIWKYLPGDIEKVRVCAVPEKDLMVQRYIFLQTTGVGSLKKSSFMFGLRGFIDIYKYTLEDDAPEGIKDIVYLCNTAKRRLQEVGEVSAG